MEDFDRCYRALQSRDARFDGWFFTAVTSTGIYCRPSCPALTPKRENVRFFPTAAAAQQAGFRACLRCRPDAAPGSPQWLGRADIAARALKLIFDGIVDRQGVSGLARQLGYGERQLHRVLMAEVGTGALALARAQRAQTARLLIETTHLPLAQVAFAAGFTSVRQFNDTVRDVFARTPTELRAAIGRGHARRRVPTSASAPGQPAGPPPVTVRLAYRRPFAAEELFGFLGRRAVPGLECSDSDGFRRSLRLPHGPGMVALAVGDGYLEARFALTDLRDLSTAIARCRHLANLDADPEAVDEALEEDGVLAPLVRARPGLRVPGSVDGFETAVRAVLGQQVSLSGARTLGADLMEAAGEGRAQVSGTGLPGDLGPVGALRPFPSPEALVELLSRQQLRLPAGRRRALLSVSEAVADGRLSLDASMPPVELSRALVALPGIGPWTAAYVAMRALADPDAFLPTDLGSRRAAGRLGLPEHPTALSERAEQWRPWRAYAQMHLWSAPTAAEPAAEPTARAAIGRAVKASKKESAA
jgi:AraC family transcriptional regulator, regulatory protein of adaptative response / DNA-3-methyladenine glycosylase II